VAMNSKRSTAIVALLVPSNFQTMFDFLPFSLQGMAFSVAMNSKRSNAIVALLIASNFAEIKGVVLKRFDPRRLLILSFQVCTVSHRQVYGHCAIGRHAACILSAAHFSPGTADGHLHWRNT